MVGLVGCGGGDGEPATLETDRSTSPASAVEEEGDAHEVTIAASEFALEVPEVVPAGEVTFVLENMGALAHHAQLVQIPSSSLATFRDDDGFGRVMNEATWLGGPATVESQSTSAPVTTTLQPGTYAFLCMLVTDGSEHATRGMRTTFVVEGDRVDPPAPSVTGTVSLDEFAFDVPDDFDGNGSFLVRNDGSLDHELSIVGVEDGATRAEVRDAFEQWDGSVPAPETLTFEGGVQAMRFRKTQVVDLDLDAGTYAFVCFVPEGGTRHWEKGMLRLFEVP